MTVCSRAWTILDNQEVKDLCAPFGDIGHTLYSLMSSSSIPKIREPVLSGGLNKKAAQVIEAYCPN